MTLFSIISQRFIHPLYFMWFSEKIKIIYFWTQVYIWSPIHFSVTSGILHKPSSRKNVSNFQLISSRETFQEVRRCCAVSEVLSRGYYPPFWCGSLSRSSYSVAIAPKGMGEAMALKLIYWKIFTLVIHNRLGIFFQFDYQMQDYDVRIFNHRIAH